MTHLVRTFPALDPRDPAAVQTWSVGLEQGQLDALLKNNDRVRLARLLLAKEVVENPVVVFEDLKRPDQQDGLCYCEDRNATSEVLKSSCRHRRAWFSASS